MESTILNFRSSPWRFALRETFHFLSEDSVMSFSDALFTFLFGVGLPSWDVYSDLIFALTLVSPRCYDYEAYLYYEKYHNWSRKYIIFRGIYDKAKMFLKCFYFIGKDSKGNCIDYDFFQCPETKMYLYIWYTCNTEDDCGDDGSAELYCNGKGTTILSII